MAHDGDQLLSAVTSPQTIRPPRSCTDSRGASAARPPTSGKRAIVVAHYYLGLSQQEIAEAVDVRRRTVSATVSQSLARM